MACSACERETVTPQEATVACGETPCIALGWHLGQGRLRHSADGNMNDWRGKTHHWRKHIALSDIWVVITRSPNIEINYMGH